MISIKTKLHFRSDYLHVVQVQLLVMRDAILTALEMLLYAFTGAAFPDARPPCMLLQDCP